MLLYLFQFKLYGKRIMHWLCWNLYRLEFLQGKSKLSWLTFVPVPKWHTRLIYVSFYLIWFRLPDFNFQCFECCSCYSTGELPDNIPDNSCNTRGECCATPSPTVEPTKNPTMRPTTAAPTTPVPTPAPTQ